MSIESLLDDIKEAINHQTAAIEANTAALSATGAAIASASTASSTVAAPARRTRSAKAESTAGSATVEVATSTASTEEKSPASIAAAPVADPFPGAPTVTKEDVRTAALALSAATTQDNAVAVIKAATGVGYAELNPLQFAAALAALQAALPAPKVADADPFAVATSSVTTVQEDAPSLEDVQKAARSARGRTGTGKVESIVMAHGGKAVDPADGTIKPSLKALPISAYAATIADLNALPKTK